MKIRDKYSDAWVIRPGDYVAVILKGPTSPEEGHRIREQLRKAWPDVNVALFADGIELKVMRAERVKQQEAET